MDNENGAVIITKQGDNFKLEPHGLSMAATIGVVIPSLLRYMAENGIPVETVDSIFDDGKKVYKEIHQLPPLDDLISFLQSMNQ